MAQRLSSFDFTAQSAITSAESKGRNRYPWDQWFDGDIWKLTQGDDFDTSPLMMERIIRTRASNRNHKARVTLRHLPALNGDSASIVLQRIDIDGPSKQSEQADQRAAKRAERAEKRAAKKAAAEAAALETLKAAGIQPVTKINGVSKHPSKKAPVKRKQTASA